MPLLVENGGIYPIRLQGMQVLNTSFYSGNFKRLTRH
jgi:hypothetical protein